MRWNKKALLPMALAAALAPLSLSTAAPERQLTVYRAQSSYSLPLLERDATAYVAVDALLSPLGAVTAKEKNKVWRVQLNKAEARLTEGKDKAAVRGAQIDLGGKVVVEQQRVLIPMSGALPLLTRLLNVSVDFHQPSRRLFIGNAFARFTTAYSGGSSPTLTLNFSQAVHPESSSQEAGTSPATSGARTTLIFRKEPLISDVNRQQFGEGPIQSLLFNEENGMATLTVTGNAPLKIIRSDDGRTIAFQSAAPASSALSTPAPGAPSAPDNQRRFPEFFVMIDPGHGGYDKGAAFTPKLLEKDVTLKLARELRKELEERGIASRMLRDSDVDVPLERRAESTNEQRAGIYIALHAGRPGRGVRVYTELPATAQANTGGRFLPWESAQIPALEKSRMVGNAVTTELRKKGLAAATLGLPVRPLNNIVVPAIAVEITPESGNLPSLESAKRNAGIVSAIASAINQVRGQLGARP